MDGNLDRQAMTADLESMREVGIGYVLFLEVNVGVPRGQVDMLSEEWQELFAHAVRECERLGIRLIMGSGPGWAGSGGPWVKPEQSMMHLVSTTTRVKGPVQFTGILPVPLPHPPFFGEGTLTPGLRTLREEWYEDVTLLAVPTPKVGSVIDRLDEKSLVYRAPYTSQPGVAPFLPDPADAVEVFGAAIDPEAIIDLTGQLQPDGTLHWEVPAGDWTIIRFGKRNNGAVTRPAPAPGLGFEADKFDAAAFDDHYEHYIGRLIRKSEPRKSATGGGWTMIHIDSWEMGAQNWSHRFREEFIARRGYDPLPYLPAYAGLTVESAQVTERFLWDVRQTSNELIMENHAMRFKELGRRNGFMLSIEPYDMNPAADLDLGSVADVPMCEFWSDGYGFNSAFSCFEATSIAHVQGKPVVAAEAFTAMHTEAWKLYPELVKNQGDWAFCMGINRLVYHTFAHKPYGDQLRPGVSMGPYGVHWDRGQTWWTMSSAYHQYIARCQYVLSQGINNSDILYLTPEGAPMVFLPPKSALEGTDVLPDKRGYAFDGISPNMLMQLASAQDGRIVFPGGASYAVLVLPGFKTMTPELLTTIAALARAGATIIGNPPAGSPSLVNYPQCDEQVQRLADSLWQAGMIIRPAGEPDGLYPDYEFVAGVLSRMGVHPDFSASGSIRYTHRTMPGREVYFLSNRTAQALTDTCTFRNGSLNAERWDPVTGEITKLEGTKTSNPGIRLPVSLEPHQSCFILFSHNLKSKTQNLIPKTQYPKPVYSFTGPWKVSFDPAWGGPAEAVFDSLADWSRHPDDGIRHYSGSATYVMEFDLPRTQRGTAGPELWLDLGTVRNMARVRLNGKELGILWTAPWRIRIDQRLKEKGNCLEIEVVNLWINRLIGDEREPWDGIEKGQWPDWLLNGEPRPTNRYTFTTHRFYKQGDPLVESGLIGPVKILSFAGKS
jgi:hypothetical protein